MDQRSLLRVGAPALIAERSLSQTRAITVADPGGPFGEAYGKAFYKPFEATTGIRVTNVGEAMCGFWSLGVIGTPESIADMTEEWFTTDAADGFMLRPPYLPGAADDFVEPVIPETGAQPGCRPPGVRSAQKATEPAT